MHVLLKIYSIEPRGFEMKKGVILAGVTQYKDYII